MRRRGPERSTAEHSHRPHDNEDQDLCQRGWRQRQWEPQNQPQQTGQDHWADRQAIVCYSVIFMVPIGGLEIRTD